MDIAARKLTIVQRLLEIDDEEIIHNLEDLLNNLLSPLDPYSPKEIKRVAEEVERLCKKGEWFTTQEILNYLTLKNK
ncbi:hypothetical protein KIH41_12550 [Litoribacter ruber]|uniref:Addiction module protein n=1 Tax=Litoribacter ruber TaxID=702568 RepID=A0AAP2G4I4_9BACT|nr:MULTISPECIES: hypothetical protein [Litoribacter]MBS9523478.1 hypothetical protein [Litoribacter alkaliphilus]MBT0812106.1 hypothetical protein [Litoribacter ruber]